MRYTYNVSVADANFECADVQEVIASENLTCFFGASSYNTTNYPPIVFRVDAAPSNSNVHIYTGGT